MILADFFATQIRLTKMKRIRVISHRAQLGPAPPPTPKSVGVGGGPGGGRGPNLARWD